MNATTTCSSPHTLCSHHQWRFHHLINPNFSISSSLRRRKNSKKPNKPSSDQRIEMVIDVENVANRATTSIKRFVNDSESKLSEIISSGMETFNDLKTLVTVDSDRRIIISCQRSSLMFLANSLIWSIVFVFVTRFVIKFGFLVYRSGFSGGFVWRRDRSLAGREMVVGKRRFKEREGKKKDFNFRVPINPLSPVRGVSMIETENAALRPQKQVSTKEELPNWWPDFVPSSSVPTKDVETHKEANRVIRAIMDNRMSGKDITEDDIVQFRRLCRTSGARVYIETANARDSFFRASVDFVLNSCSSSSSTIAQIDGEDARQFVAGLADSIGLQYIRAARIVSAAVAARTRSWFLQAWALEIQGKRAEAEMELSKICRIHQIFPPQESSPEMEMVAKGLEKHLRVEQRTLLLNLLEGVCGAANRSAAEALGLITRPLVVEDDWRRTL